MSGPATHTVAIVSFRLGGHDGVSVESAKWADLFRDLRWTVRTVAGSGPVDVVVEGLDFNDARTPSLDAVRAAFSKCDVVVVENLEIS